MDEFESLSHSKWECKYHVVFIPKFRRKVLYGELRKHLGEVFRKLAEHRESRVEEGHLLMGWTAPRTASSVPRWSSLQAPSGREPSVGKSIIDTSSVTRVGLDLAKRVFRIHAVDATGS